MSEQKYPGPSQMVKIDGSRVRSLRESKGLTQLYIATFVGVTTDTISRWENRRYPSIKEENALKLAEALEIPLNQILEKETEASTPEEARTFEISQAGPPKVNRILPWLLPLLIVLLLPFVWYGYRQPAPAVISATRILPPHIPEGQPFPVVIHLTAKQQGPISLIIKETLPPGCEPITSAPPYTSFDRKTGTLKWISRAAGPATAFVYLAKRTGDIPAAERNTPLRFNGSVTQGDRNSPETVVAGGLVLPIAGYHWADANSDNRIEDVEILAVYDTFSALDSINYDWQEIDTIWSGESYYWDADKKKYVVLR